MTVIGQVVTSAIEQDKEKRELGEAEVQSFIKDLWVFEQSAGGLMMSEEGVFRAQTSKCRRPEVECVQGTTRGPVWLRGIVVGDEVSRLMGGAFQMIQGLEMRGQIIGGF